MRFHSVISTVYGNAGTALTELTSIRARSSANASHKNLAVATEFYVKEMSAVDPREMKLLEAAR